MAGDVASAILEKVYGLQAGLRVDLWVACSECEETRLWASLCRDNGGHTIVLKGPAQFRLDGQGDLEALCSELAEDLRATLWDDFHDHDWTLEARSHGERGLICVKMLSSVQKQALVKALSATVTAYRRLWRLSQP